MKTATIPERRSSSCCIVQTHINEAMISIHILLPIPRCPWLSLAAARVFHIDTRWSRWQVQQFQHHKRRAATWSIVIIVLLGAMFFGLQLRGRSGCVAAMVQSSTFLDKRGEMQAKKDIIGYRWYLHTLSS